MPDPARTLPRAIMVAILLVMLLYVTVGIAVFGHLTTAEAIEAKDYALAEAARPLFGPIGFTVVAITALISTASSINANLYAVTNVTYQLAKQGQLPDVFGKPIAKSREGLLISGFLVIVLSLLFDLSQIAAIGSIAVLLVHGVTHIGHLKVLDQTGANRILVLLAAVCSLMAMLLAIVFVARSAPSIVLLLLGFVIFAFALEIVLQRLMKRKIRPRITG